MSTKEYKEIYIYNDTAINEQSILETNQWLFENGVKLDIKKDNEKITFILFKSYGVDKDKSDEPSKNFFNQ